MVNFRERYAVFIVKNFKAIISLAILLAVASGLYAGLRLESKTGVLDLYSEKNPIFKRFIGFSESFGVAEDLMIVVEGEDAALQRQAIETLAQNLSQDPHHLIKSLLYRLNVEFFEKHFLEFLSAEELETIHREIKDPNGGVRALFQSKDLASFYKALNAKLRLSLKKGSSLDAEATVKNLKNLLQPLVAMQAALEKDDFSTSPFSTKGAILDEQGYLRATPGNFYILFLRPNEYRQDYKYAQELVKWSREVVQTVRNQYPQLKIGITGGPALAHDQFTVSEADMNIATLFALATTMLIFFFAFKAFGRPLLGLATLLLCISYTFGMATLTIGYLNMFSLAFVVIMIGQGTYYGVHIVARYEEFLQKGLSVTEAVSQSVIHNFRNITISALTTMTAFFTAALIDFKGFAQLGFIAGVGVLMSCVGMQLILPALILWREQHRTIKTVQPQIALPGKWAKIFAQTVDRYSKAIIILAIIGLLGGMYLFLSPNHGIAFDHNLLNLQAKNTEAVDYEKKLIDTNLSPRAGVYIVNDYAVAQKLATAASLLKSVSRVEWAGDFLPNPNLRPQVIKETKKSLRLLNANPVKEKITVAEVQQLQAELKQLQENFVKIQNQAFNVEGGDQIINILEEGNATITSIQNILDDVIASEARQSSALNKFQNLFFKTSRHYFSQATKSQTLAEKDIPEGLLKPFINPLGQFAVYVFPQVNIWEKSSLFQFVEDLRSLDQQVTGSPIMFKAIIDMVESNYFKAATYSAIAIFILFFINFRSLKLACCCFIPLIFGVSWHFGLMSLLGLTFNTANMIALPMILGIGADNGVHLMERYLEEPSQGVNVLLKSTGKALLITYFDSVTSFLGMAFARHQGLAELGQVVILGLTTCTLAGVILLPALLKHVLKNNMSLRGEPKQSSLLTKII
ncbi:MAG: MMPL family transporter [Deltaproteobacteria bacterium]|nr:MMPL family transporter [Deltaproteobacteria bacterium]